MKNISNQNYFLFPDKIAIFLAMIIELDDNPQT
jgi:hypothetical protein